MQNDHISVLVGDSTRLSSNVLSDALRRDEHFDVVNACASAAEILNSADAHKPDVALISAALDDVALKGFDVCYRLHVVHPETAVVILTDGSVRDLILGAFAAGARGVFSRDECVEALNKCIYSVHMGQVWANSRQMRFLLEAFAATAPPQLFDAKGTVLLTKREQDVVGCVAEGLTNREIAARLCLSEHTIKNYIFRIFEKLGVSTRVELVLYYFSQRSPARSDGSVTNDRMSDVEHYYARADSGDSLAQLRLAEVYSRDPAVAKDKLSISMWLILAETIASAVKESAGAARAKCEASLTVEEIAELETRVRRWLDVHTDRLGPLRLVAGLRDQKPQLTRFTDGKGEDRGEREAVRFSTRPGDKEEESSLSISLKARKKIGQNQATA